MSWPAYPLVGFQDFLLSTSNVLPRQGSLAALPATYILVITFETFLSPPNSNSGTPIACCVPRDSLNLSTVNNSKPKTTRRSSKFIWMEQKSDRKRPENNPSQRAFARFSLGCPRAATAETPVLPYLPAHDDVADMSELAIFLLGLDHYKNTYSQPSNDSNTPLII